MRSLAFLFFVLVVPLHADLQQPEPASGYVKKEAAYGEKCMVSTANFHATKEGLAILKQGGSAIDAAVAIQMVLNVTEPQSSGIGGGAFLLYYNHADQSITVYDGRECAPKATTEGYFLDEEGYPIETHMAGLGGKAVGIPGVLKMLEMAHQENGQLPWDSLFTKAISLCKSGFPLSPRLDVLITSNFEALSHFSSPEDLFFAGGKKSPQAVVMNPKLGETLSKIASGGADVFYRGEIAEKIVEKIRKSILNPGIMTVKDLWSYEAIKRKPIQFTYKNVHIYSLPPPSASGIALAQILGMLETKDLKGYDLGSLEFVNLFSQASLLAFADRNYFVADPAFFSVPTEALIDKKYLATRASLLKPRGTLEKIKEGEEPKKELQALPLMPCANMTYHGTTHFCVVDEVGNAACMTSSLGQGFGSKLNVEGFFLNSQLSDFCLEKAPRPAAFANRPEPGKRPLSSMAPTLVFDSAGYLVLMVGSAGGQPIIDYVAQALLGTLEFGLNIQETLNFPHYVATNESILLEKGTFITNLLKPLKAMKQSVSVKPLNSGSHGIEAAPGGGWLGGADPRREGLALGE